MPLLQTRLPARRFGWLRPAPGSSMSTRLVALPIGINKPRKARNTAKKYCTCDDDLAQRTMKVLLAHLAKNARPATPPPTPTFDPDADENVPYAYTAKKFLFLTAVDSLDLHDKKYSGYLAFRDGPCEAGPSAVLPSEIWTDIAIRSGDGKAARRMARLGHGFAEAARMHEDNVTPICKAWRLVM